MSKQPVEVRLIVLTGNRVGEEIVVEEEATLGRLAACDLHFEDKLASRRHAKVRVGPDGVYLEDLGSSNGTQLHGERIREARLEDGDQRISANSFELRDAHFAEVRGSHDEVSRPPRGGQGVPREAPPQLHRELR